jgi:sialate O-acetylesterase
MKQSIFFISILLIVLTTKVNSLFAEIKLPSVFGNNMVLQRDSPIRIWGKAEKNELVTISFKGFTEKVKADKIGKWGVQLPPMKFGGSFSMTIKGKDNTIVFDNILIGDVWICSGQSNMAFRLAGDYTAKEEIMASENKNIRLLTVPRTIQTQEQDDIPQTSWVECNPNTTPDFSAVAYFFGKNLQKELNIPIGLIDASWGGTNIETWTSWEASMNNNEFVKYEGKTLEQAWGHTTQELNKYVYTINNEDDGVINKWYLPDTDGTGWKNIYAPKAWDGELIDERGIVWFRRKITLPADVAGKAGKLHLGMISDVDRS